jgi:hypothetical protein
MPEGALSLMNIVTNRASQQSRSASAKKSELRSTTAARQYTHNDDSATGELAEQRSKKSFTPIPEQAPLPATPPLISPHHRQSDRGSGDGDVAARLPVFVRFHDLRAAGIVSNWPQLYNLIDEYGFPAGVMLSPNRRAWNVDDVRAWLDSRPTERKKVVVPRSKQHEKDIA